MVVESREPIVFSERRRDFQPREVGIRGFSIDVQHWRHYFMFIGVLWGLFAAAAAYRRTGRRERTSHTASLGLDAVPSPRG